MYVLEFAPPMENINGHFNTVRLGGAWAKRLATGDSVLLIAKFQTIGQALVEHVEIGKLSEMAKLHAAQNHNQKSLDPGGAPERLVAAMIKRYGPHKVSHNSLCTVIYLRLI